jgi:hypothetical protein
MRLFLDKIDNFARRAGQITSLSILFIQLSMFIIFFFEGDSGRPKNRYIELYNESTTRVFGEIFQYYHFVIGVFLLSGFISLMSISFERPKYLFLKSYKILVKGRSLEIYVLGANSVLIVIAVATMEFLASSGGPAPKIAGSIAALASYFNTLMLAILLVTSFPYRIVFWSISSAVIGTINAILMIAILLSYSAF